MKKKVSSKRWKWMIFLLAICIALLGVLLKFNIDRIAVYKAYLDNGIPRININLEGVSLEEIKEGSKETKYEGNELELYNEGRVTEFDGVEVKGRGNMTWYHDKKPYQIKFLNATDLLGLGKNKKWVLLANSFDYSFLRNDIALMLAEMLGEDYNNVGEFVELYFNGEYEGLYYLVPKIEISKGSVDLRNEDGVLFEIDTLHRQIEECYTSFMDDCLILKDTVEKDNEKKEIIINEFLKDFQEIEIAIKEGRYGDISEKIDLESFAQYYLINEFTINPDAYMSSFFLYRGDDGKIYAGPVWDFDYSLGNHEWTWHDDENYYSPFSNEKNMNTKIMRYLSKIPEFREEVNRVYREKLKGRKEELLKEIQDKNSEIQKAILKDNKKWGIQDSGEEFNYLFNWVKARYEYFEQEYGNIIEEFNDQRRFQFL